MSATTLLVGAVILTYNSTEDLRDCLAGLIAQTGIDLRIIVVDNASRLEERVRMEADFLDALPEGRFLPADDDNPEDVAAIAAVFLRNVVNGGYSAGTPKTYAAMSLAARTRAKDFTFDAYAKSLRAALAGTSESTAP
jgi:GT2 family glycosyltransferase